jgi:hypothetical protein
MHSNWSFLFGTKKVSPSQILPICKKTKFTEQFIQDSFRKKDEYLNSLKGKIVSLCLDAGELAHSPSLIILIAHPFESPKSYVINIKRFFGGFTSDYVSLVRATLFR